LEQSLRVLPTKSFSSCARSPLKLKGLAREAGVSARYGPPRKAAQDAEALLLAVHWSRIDDVLAQADLSGKVVITCSLPMTDDDRDLLIAHTSSGAEELAKKLPRARVVSAFNTMPSEVLLRVFYESRRSVRRPSLVYCGNDRSAKALAAALITDAGFDPLDAGGLRIARYTEPFALLVGELA